MSSPPGMKLHEKILGSLNLKTTGLVSYLRGDVPGVSGTQKHWLQYGDI